MRSLDELLDVSDPAWETVREWIDSASNRVEVLPPNEQARAVELVAAQVSVRSHLGAILYHSAGLLIDDGWLRLLGSGAHPRFVRSLMGFNRGRTFRRDDDVPGMLLIADDVLGGFFALDGGAAELAGEGRSEVYYHAPETLEWQRVAGNYAEFLQICWYGDLDRFYAGLRWENWRTEVAALSADEALAAFPAPHRPEGLDLGRSVRTPVAVGELWDRYVTRKGR